MVDGGFGGGSICFHSISGAGGGYSGGGAGVENTDTGGGGGGSYTSPNSITPMAQLGYNSTDGYVKIQ
jgi:hypothetical protein